MGAASTQAMVFPATAPMTPLGACQPPQLAGLINPLGQPLPQADELQDAEVSFIKAQCERWRCHSHHQDHKRTGAKDSVSAEYMVIISCAVLASGSDHCQGCSSAMGHADACATSSDYQPALYRKYFTIANDCCRSNNEGRVAQLTFT